MKLLVDGQQVASAQNPGGGTLSTYRFIQLGFGTFHELVADTDMYLDDIAVDVKPIGCLP